MRTAVIAFTVLALASYANAECANACSGHGTCENNDQCMCFPNWMASDCSERVCPYGLAFVDTPRGDLNHDGVRSTGSAGMVSVMSSSSQEFEVYPSDASTIKDAQDDEGHFYTECSNKGLCDRELGLCQCFDGYTGSSCQRTVCPNDCSGHGVCRTVEEIADGGMNYKKTDSVGSENFWSGMSFGSSVLYRLWDMDKSQGCVCDPGYSGPDCTRRECPRGDDPLTHRNRDCGGAACDNEVQVHTINTSGGAAFVDWFSISFRDWTGEVWRTDYFQYGTMACVASTDAERAKIIKDQLQAIPNAVFEEIDVVVDTTTTANALIITIDFLENSGNIAELSFNNGAREQITWGQTCSATADLAVDYDVISAVSTDGTTEESTCSNRGLCDYSTGVCKCFRGYFNDDCGTQNALAGAVSSA